MTEFTEQQRREIAGRARTLHERLDGPPNSSGSEPPMDPDRIIAEWRNRFPDEESFRNRLDDAGLSESAVRNQIAATRWPDDEPLPDWLDDLERLVRHVEATPTADREPVAVPEETPFANLLSAIASHARDELTVEVPRDAVSGMVEGLVSQLESTCIRALYVEFKSFVEYHDPELANADPEAFDDPPTALYEQFVDAMFEKGFRNLCLEYPVLARQLVHLLGNWTDAVEEVCQRVREDAPALRERFDVEDDLVALEPLADDAHAGGRVPLRVSFGRGDVIYKPRPVDGGVAFYGVLDRLDDHLDVPSFRTPTYLPREEYGWMEEIAYADLPDAEVADRYYERAGAILAVAYALNYTDCQLENLLAAGEHPMLVDGETLFHPHVASDAKPVPTGISEMLDRSVLLTALLPWSAGDPREPDEDGLAASFAGFGSRSEQTKLADRTVPEVEAIGTDVMSVVESDVTVERDTNTPSVDGEDHPPSDHVDAIVDGFAAAYETISDRHDAGRFLPEVVEPDRREETENRLVYRATMQYRSIRRSSAARNPLRDGARLTVELEELAVPFFDGQIETDRYWPMYAAERRALRELDVPRFTSRVDDRTVFHDGEPLDVTADESGLERVRRRLDAMDPADRRQQCWLLRQIFDSTATKTPPPSADELADPTAGDARPLSDERLLDEATDLFDDVLDAAFESPTGDGWLSVWPGDSDVNLVPADHTLFWGRGGIALTAAALHGATDCDRYRQVAVDVLDPLLADLDAGQVRLGLGGTKGIGSVVYVLSVVADLLGDDAYREAALDASELVTTERLDADDTLDVMEGSAGTLLGLLAYHERYGDSSVLDRAVACGERLLDARVTVNGHQVWETTDDGAPITGFSHGSSGIGYSLARLSAATGEARFAEAAREAVAFEETLYVPAQDNWAPSTAAGEFQDRWCHGRSGIALSRVGMGEQLGDDDLLADAADALLATAENEASHLDNVCCGNFGRVEAMLVGSRRAGIDRSHATELAARCLARREREGTLSLAGHHETFVNPTFFDGITGPAYGLLRLRRPDDLPSVLLLE